MTSRTDAPTARSQSAPLDAALRAASSEALAQRVRDLEKTLADERAQVAAKAKQVEAGVSVLRKALQDLRAETVRARDENRRLDDQLQQSRRVVAAMSVPARAPADEERIAELEVALAAARDEVSVANAGTVEARRDVDSLRDRVRALESEIASRDESLHQSAVRITELEDALVTARREADAAAALALAAEAEAARRDARTAAPLSDEDGTLDDAPPATGAVPAAAPAPRTPSAVPAVPEMTAELAAAAKRNDAQHGGADAAPQDPSIPQIAGLRIERFVEEGATGRVYEAREIESRRPVLVRVLPGVLKLLDGKRLDSMLLAKHSNLVSVLSFAVCRQGPYLVMEREDGETARAWVARIGPLPERIALSVALEAARGLRQAAFHGALHCDLGPDAVLIDVAGHVRVRGVGLRAVFAPQGDTPREPEFASPERLRGNPPPDVRADIYSLGAILHMLLTSQSPYKGDRDAVLRQQAAGALPDVRELRNDVSEETSKLVRKLLSSDPDLRPQTWDQLLVELERRVPGRVSTALRGNLGTRVKRFLTAHPWVLGAALAGMLLVAGIFRMVVATDPTAADRFREAKTTAEKMAKAGDFEGARTVYQRFLSGTGDPDVEREAARRFDELGGKPTETK